MKNYYEILQVDIKASKQVIEMAYKALAKQYHPDLNPVEDREQCEEMMKLLNEAREILTDDEKKELYDNELFYENKEYELVFDEYIKYIKKHRKILTFTIIGCFIFFIIIAIIESSEIGKYYSFRSFIFIYYIIAAYIWHFVFQMTHKKIFSFIIGLIFTFSYCFIISLIYTYWKAYKVIKEIELIKKSIYE